MLHHLKIGVKLPLAMAMVGALSMTAADFIALSNAREIVLDAGTERLSAEARARAADVARDLTFMRDDVLSFAQNPLVVDATSAFVAGWKQQSEDPGQSIRRRYLGRLQESAGTAELRQIARDNSSYGFVHRRYSGFFTGHRDFQDYADIYIVSPDGWVVYSVSKRDSFGLDLSDARVGDTGLGRAFVGAAGAAQGTEGRVTAFTQYPPGSGTQSAFFAAPVFSLLGSLEGVVIFRIGDDRLDAPIAGSHSLGAEGMVTVLGPNEAASGTLREAGPADGTAPPAPGAGPPAAQSPALVGETDAQFVTATVPVPFPGLDLRVVAKQPRAEIMRTVESLRAELMREGGTALLIVAILGALMARSITKPLARVGAAMKMVGEEGFPDAIPDRQRGDEIGAIARQLDAFRAKLLQAEGLTRENAFKRAAFEAASSPMMLVDAGMTILYVNAELEALMRTHHIALGRSVSKFHPNALAGRSLFSLFPGSGRLRDAVMRGDGREAVMRVGQVHLKLNMALITDAKNELLGFVVEWSDMTESFWTRSLMDVIGAQFPIAGFSSDGRLIHSNALFSDWTHGVARNSVARRWDAIFKPGTLNPSSASWAAMTDGDPAQTTAWLLPPGGAEQGREALLSRVAGGSSGASRYVLVLSRSADGPSPATLPGLGAETWETA